MLQSMNKFMNHIRSFLKWQGKEKMLFLEAVLFLFTAKIFLLVLPFKYCIRFLNNKYSPDEKSNPEQIKSIKNAVDRANQLAFWDNICLVQSITAHWMCQRRKIGSCLFIGVAHDENKKIIAHAWLKVNDFEMVTKGFDYKELYSIE